MRVRPDGVTVEPTDGPVVVDAAVADELVSILKDADTYDWEMAKACEFVPGLAVRFIGRASTTDVLFCFQCDELMIFQDGTQVRGEDFVSARGRLIRFFKRVFPDDAEIQSLQ